MKDSKEAVKADKIRRRRKNKFLHNKQHVRLALKHSTRIKYIYFVVDVVAT